MGSDNKNVYPAGAMRPQYRRYAQIGRAGRPNDQIDATGQSPAGIVPAQLRPQLLKILQHPVPPQQNDMVGRKKIQFHRMVGL